MRRAISVSHGMSSDLLQGEMMVVVFECAVAVRMNGRHESEARREAHQAAEQYTVRASRLDDPTADADGDRHQRHHGDHK
ncbi:hypothetical protein [Streptomyces sp. NPDC058891]|uniref:hypothetical protein n=2 Tax=Streptomyces TaxID=1883 RepID=UPI0036945450